MDSLNDHQEKFHELVLKLNFLFHERREIDSKLISDILDELNNLNYSNPLVNHHARAVLLINQCCSRIPTDEDILIPKCCQLIKKLIGPQKVVITGTSFNVNLNWCLKVLNHTQYQVDVLSAIDVIIRSDIQNSKYVYKSYIADILSPNGPVVKLLKDTSNQINLRYSYQVLEACTTILTIPNNQHQKYSNEFTLCGNLFLNYLKTSPDLTDTVNLKTLIICIRGLENIISENADVLSENLDIILGIIKSYMLLGVKKIDFLPPNRLIPSVVSVTEIKDVQRKGGKIKKQRKTKASMEPKKTEDLDNLNQNLFNINLEDRLEQSTSKNVTSDSDFSDNELNKMLNIPRLESRIRHSALSLFFVVSKKANKSILFSFWSNFIPENMLSSKHNLITCILQDSSPKARSAALNVLLNLLTLWKLYLLRAEIIEKNTSFTTFFTTLGHMLIKLHHCLNLALNENVTSILIQVLKVYVALIQASSYHKLTPGLITKTVRRIKQFVYHKDHRVQEIALIIFGCILASEPTVPETKEIFLKNKQQSEELIAKNDAKDLETDFEYAEFSSDDEEDLILNENYQHMPWILERCLTNLSPESHSVEKIKIESIHVISAACRNYFDSLILPYLLPIEKTFNFYLGDETQDLIRLHSGQCVVFIGQWMDHYFINNGDFNNGAISLALTFWQNLLNGSLTSLIQSEKNPDTKAVGCDCIGGIGSYIYERLPSDKQILCVTLLFACSRDEAASVRGSAIRSLGILVSCPILREDIGFMVDVAEAVYRSLLDDHPTVKLKASWSLGNLSESLVFNKSNDELEEIPHSLLFKLLEVAVKSSVENEKIKMNIARALGRLLQLVNEDAIKMSSHGAFKNVIQRAVESLAAIANTSTMMKVVWNACYAIGCVLINDILMKELYVKGIFFPTLNNLLTTSKNFKVRINAALALSTPTKKDIYGTYYNASWIALLKTLQKSQNIEEHSEYQHRDHLIEQICLTTAHLTLFVEAEDLNDLYNHLNLYSDLLKSQIKRVYDIVVPEKSNIIIKAGTHLKTFKKDKLSNSQGVEALNILKDIFLQVFISN